MKGIWLLVLTTSQLAAAPLVLVVDGVGSTFYETESGFAQSETDFSGVILADVELDIWTGNPSVFRFTGGAVNYSDGETTYTPYLIPQIEELTFTNTGISGPLVSLSVTPLVDPLTGFLSNADHVQNLTQGSVRTEYRRLIFGVWVTLFDDTLDLSEQPTSNPLSGTTKIESELLELGALEDRYRIDLTHVSDSDPKDVTDPDTGISLTITSIGGFSASGEVKVPSSAYQAWLAGAGMGMAENVEGLHPQTGLSLAVLYALGLDAGSSGIPLRVDGETHEAVLDLPTSGTRAELKLEYSADLEVWDVLGLDGLEGAMITLVVGSSGEVRIPLPSGRRGFVRLRI